MSADAEKKTAAQAAIRYLEPLLAPRDILGVGTGSTVNHFIDLLPQLAGRFSAAVASSEASATRLRALNIPVIDLNAADALRFYVDGADESNAALQLIKGGGGALTREKIIAENAEEFICIADQSKQVNALGRFPLPVEVIPMARSLVGRALVKLGGDPVYREGFVTDNGNIILDVHNLVIADPVGLEERINNLVGVVCNGLFARRGADLLLLGGPGDTTQTLRPQ